MLQKCKLTQNRGRLGTPLTLHTTFEAWLIRIIDQCNFKVTVLNVMNNFKKETFFEYTFPMRINVGAIFDTLNQIFFCIIFLLWSCAFPPQQDSQILPCQRGFFSFSLRAALIIQHLKRLDISAAFHGKRLMCLNVSA